MFFKSILSKSTMQNFSIEVDGYVITEALVVKGLRYYFEKIMGHSPNIYVAENEICEDENTDSKERI